MDVVCNLAIREPTPAHLQPSSSGSEKLVDSGRYSSKHKVPTRGNAFTDPTSRYSQGIPLTASGSSARSTENDIVRFARRTCCFFGRSGRSRASPSSVKQSGDSSAASGFRAGLDPAITSQQDQAAGAPEREFVVEDSGISSSTPPAKEINTRGVPFGINVDFIGSQQGEVSIAGPEPFVFRGSRALLPILSTKENSGSQRVGLVTPASTITSQQDKVVSAPEREFVVEDSGVSSSTPPAKEINTRAVPFSIDVDFIGSHQGEVEPFVFRGSRALSPIPSTKENSGSQRVGFVGGSSNSSPTTPAEINVTQVVGLVSAPAGHRGHENTSNGSQSPELEHSESGDSHPSPSRTLHDVTESTCGEVFMSTASHDAVDDRPSSDQVRGTTAQHAGKENISTPQATPTSTVHHSIENEDPLQIATSKSPASKTAVDTPSKSSSPPGTPELLTPHKSLSGRGQTLSPPATERGISHSPSPLSPAHLLDLEKDRALDDEEFFKQFEEKLAERNRELGLEEAHEARKLLTKFGIIQQEFARLQGMECCDGSDAEAARNLANHRIQETAKLGFFGTTGSGILVY
jgi:hypothetical protein